MRKTLLCIGIIYTLFRTTYFFLNHETLFPISRRTADIVATNGLFHYTTTEKAKQILATASITGYPDTKSTFPMRRKRNIAWFLLNSNSIWQCLFRRIIIKRHCPINPTGHDRSVKYEVKLLIKGIPPEYISNMYYNLEGGIGCYVDSLKNVTISLAPLDNIDHALGIMPQNIISSD